MRLSLIIGALAGAATLGYVALDPRGALAAWTAAFTMLVVTGVAALIVVRVLELVHAKWWLVVRAPFIAAARLPLIAPLFFLPLAIFGHALLPHFTVGFIVRSAAYLAVFAIAASRSRGGALAGPTIIVLAFVLTFAGFDWLMPLQHDWTSSMFGIWMFAEGFVGAMASIAVGAHLSHRAGLLPKEVAPDHFHAIGRLVLCSLMVWGYIGFFQLLLIWLPDLPAKITYYKVRAEGVWGVVDVFIVGRFVLALLFLLSRNLKRSSGALSVLGWFLLATQGMDCLWMVLPSVGVHLSPLAVFPIVCVVAFALAYGIRVASRLAPITLPESALRYESP